MDVSLSFAKLFAEKDSHESDQCKRAAAASVNTWSVLRKKIVDIVDQSKVMFIDISSLIKLFG